MGVYVGDKRYAPYIGDKRRRYMGGGNITDPNLIYWWSGKDELVNGYWVDRIQGFPFEAIGNPAHENNGYKCNADSKYFVANLETTVANNGTVGLNIGRYWKIIIDFTPLSIRASNGNNIIDFGSVGWSDAGFGFGLSAGYGQQKLMDNYKSTGNKTTYSVANNYNVSNILGPIVDERAVIEYGCKEGGSGDVQYFAYNNNEQVAANSHSAILFNARYGIKNGRIGSANVSSYGIGQSQIFDIKIYNYD